MKLSKLIDPKFKASLTTLNSQKMPAKCAFKLKNIVKKIDEEYEKYDQVRLAALNNYGNKKEDGSLAVDEQGNVPLEGENAQKFVAEINDLLSVSVELPTLSIKDLGDYVSLSSEDILNLEFITD